MGLDLSKEHVRRNLIIVVLCLFTILMTVDKAEAVKDYDEIMISMHNTKNEYELKNPLCDYTIVVEKEGDYMRVSLFEKCFVPHRKVRTDIYLTGASINWTPWRDILRHAYTCDGNNGEEFIHQKPYYSGDRRIVIEYCDGSTDKSISTVDGARAFHANGCHIDARIRIAEENKGTACYDTDLVRSVYGVVYCDKDNDGFKDVICRGGSDCNDYDFEVNPDTAWFYDLDGDKYGDYLAFIEYSCEKPGDHFYMERDLISPYGDYCIVNPDLQIKENWYNDDDVDGHGDAFVSSVKSCEKPEGNYFLAESLEATSDDECDDVGGVIAEENWYYDSDGDQAGLTGGEVKTSCEQPGDNYFIEKVLVNGTSRDNCDENPELFDPANWYNDDDADGHGDAFELPEKSCNQPWGNYFLAENLESTSDDRCDEVYGVYAEILWYEDADGDGFIWHGRKTQCTQPSGYIDSGIKGEDCNDHLYHSGDFAVCGTGDSCTNIETGSMANLGSGNLFDDYTLNLSNGFTVFYNSMLPESGPLGKGWTHLYHTELDISGADITLRRGDGRLIVFTGNNDGTFSALPESGLYSNITLDGDTYLLTDKYGTVTSFDKSGRMLSVVSLNGNSTTFGYSGDKLTSVTTPDNRITEFSYTGDFVSTVRYADTSYSFSYSNGHLSSISGPEGDLWNFSYTDGLLTSKTDALGNETRYVYDSSKMLISTIDGTGLTKELYYDMNGSATTVTTPDGQEWVYTYDPVISRFLSVTDPEGNTTYSTYDEHGNLLRRTEADGSVKSYTYDAFGNLTGAEGPDGSTVSYTYDEYSRLISLTDPSGAVTSYEYDSGGNLAKITSPDGNSTSYEYDDRGNVVKVTDSLGSVSTMTYDYNNNLISLTGPNGSTTVYAYDSAGRVTSVTDENGDTTSYEYDGSGNLVKVTAPDGSTIVSAYDKFGNRTSTTDALGNTTTYGYDYKGRVVSITDPAGGVTSFTYGDGGPCKSCGGSEVDRLTSITDAEGNTTSYHYDSLGRLASETDPLGNTTLYGYDVLGRVTSRTDALGRVINYGYDSAGRLTKKHYPDGTSTTYGYDARGNVTSAANSNISYELAYDMAGRLTGVTDSGGRSVEYTYDAYGRKVLTKATSGMEIAYAYDSIGRLSSITSQAGGFGISYDELGRRSSLTYPNGVTAAYSYDALGRLVSLTHTRGDGSIVASNSYTHDPVGNRTTNTNQARGAEYAYDVLYRLTEANYSTTGWSGEERAAKGKNKKRTTGGANLNAIAQQAELYTYDPVGNRLSAGHRTGYIYNDANQLTSVNGISYTYDRNGNLVRKDGDGESTTYSYDYENRLVKVERIKDGSVTVSRYAYDPFGRRIEKSVTKDGVTTTIEYLYDGEDILVEYVDGVRGNRYTHGPGIDEPLALSNNKGSYYYHADGLGSIVALTDASATVVQDYQYYFFGNLKDQKNRIKQPYRFTGREWDKEADLYYYRARYYDPYTGRFTQKDPIGFEGGINLYNYVGANPRTYVDPWGLRDTWVTTLNDGSALVTAEEDYILINSEGIVTNTAPRGPKFGYDLGDTYSCISVTSQHGRGQCITFTQTCMGTIGPYVGRYACSVPGAICGAVATAEACYTCFTSP